MKSKTIYAVKDNYADPKSIYGGTIDFITWEDKIPARAKKYIDTGKAYFHTYYFTNEEKQKEKADEIYKIYHEGVQEKQKENETLADIVNKFEYEQEIYYISSFECEVILKGYYLGYAGGKYVIDDGCYETEIKVLGINEVFETEQEARLTMLKYKKEALEEDLQYINNKIEKAEKEIKNNGK